jgi:hypothetical protein
MVTLWGCIIVSNVEFGAFGNSSIILGLFRVGKRKPLKHFVALAMDEKTNRISNSIGVAQDPHNLSRVYQDKAT